MSRLENDRHLGDQVAPQEERRRSQRVTLRVPVRLHVDIPGKPVKIDAHTSDVNDHGALLICPEAFLPETRFVLENAGTRQRIGCRVTRKGLVVAEGYHVPVEFDSPVPGFWHLTFPPTDWKPYDE